MKSADAFIDRIKTDESLLSELSNLMEKNDAQSIAELMRANGVSEEGIAELIHLDKVDTGSDTDELSDEELETVSAGSWCNGFKEVLDWF